MRNNNGLPALGSIYVLFGFIEVRPRLLTINALRALQSLRARASESSLTIKMYAARQLALGKRPEARGARTIMLNFNLDRLCHSGVMCARNGRPCNGPVLFGPRYMYIVIR